MFRLRLFLFDLSLSKLWEAELLASAHTKDFQIKLLFFFLFYLGLFFDCFLDLKFLLLVLDGSPTELVYKLFYSAVSNFSFYVVS